ncbi:F-box domain [Ceraceosorus bombacis]|uniref:F-box domain n=1 Tax=Ceraceosorus bombacis TaxID=401625 RepID=A0A0P1BFG5_9BASI|nr:F-box domain [Ceraceosorus bombacis]
MASHLPPRLPVETFSLMLAHVDAKTVFRSRRVCRRWKELIDGSDPIWRSVAIQWGRQELASACPLKTWPDPNPNSDADKHHEYDEEDFAISSSTGYFFSCPNAKELCRRYLDLTLAWRNLHTADDPQSDEEGWFVHGSVSLGRSDWEPRLVLMGSALGLTSRDDDELNMHTLRKVRTRSLIRSPRRTHAAVQNMTHYHDDVPSAYGDKHEWHAKCIISASRSGDDEQYSTSISIESDWPRTFSELPPKHTGELVLHLRLRYPLCAAVMQRNVDPDGFEWYVVVWDICTRQIKASLCESRWTSINEVDLDSNCGVIFIASAGVVAYNLVDGSAILDLSSQPWDFADLAYMRTPTPRFGPTLSGAQIHIGTAFIHSTFHRTCSHPLAVRWCTVQQAGLKPGEGDGSTLLSHVRQWMHNVDSRAEDQIRSPLQVRLDTRTDTAAISYRWGVMLVRPYSKLGKENERHLVHVGLLHYVIPDRCCPGGLSTYVSMDRMTISDGRILQSAKRFFPGMTGPGRVTDLLLMDLNKYRLDPAWRPTNHPFENVECWHLEQQVCTTVNGLKDRLVDMAIDASTVYTLRKASGLHFLDYGVAANLNAKRKESSFSLP